MDVYHGKRVVEFPSSNLRCVDTGALEFRKLKYLGSNQTEWIS